MYEYGSSNMSVHFRLAAVDSDTVVARPTALPRRTQVLRALFVVLLLSIVFGQRLGINFGSYSLNLALPAMYLLLVTAGLCGGLFVSLHRLWLFGLCIGIGFLSLTINSVQASTSSLLLVLAIYLPFLFLFQQDALGDDAHEWVTRVFLNLTFICACAGILQFYAQFVLRREWLFDFTPFLPPVLRGPAGYNTVISVGSLYKSNGFFFREPSGFSFVMALALIMEWLSYRRHGRLACLGLALLLTYSGTGILTLLLGMLFPIGPKTVLRMVLLIGIGVLAWWLLGDALNLSFTIERVGEFSSERSSAYIRYVAPLRLVKESLNEESWTLWLGHGPGTIFHAKPGYDFHDPTYAKLVFEYGLLGLVAFVGLFVCALKRHEVPQQVRAALFFSWLLMGGHLLSPEQNFTTLALIGLLPLPLLRTSSRPTPTPVPILVGLQPQPRK